MTVLGPDDPRAIRMPKGYRTGDRMKAKDRHVLDSILDVIGVEDDDDYKPNVTEAEAKEALELTAQYRKVLGL